MESYNTAEFNRLEALINGQGDVLEMISESASLADVFEAIVHWVEKQNSDGAKASILSTDKTGKHLLHGAAPSLPQAYNQAVHGIDVAYGVGSCGTAAFTKKDVIVEDISNSPLWEGYKEIAKEFNLGACWSTPLISKSGKVLGTFAIYYPEPRKPTTLDLQILRLVNRTAVVAIEHKLALDEQFLAKKRAEESEQLFRSFVLNSPMPIGIYVGKEMRLQTLNDAILVAWGKSREEVEGKTYYEALPELADQPFFKILDDVYTTGIPYHATEDRVDLMRYGKMVVTYYNFSFTPLRDEHGNIYGVMNTATEVTDLVLAKQKLADAEENLRTAIDLAELGTWQLDIPTGTITYSERLRHWFNLPPTGATLQQAIDAIVPEDKERVMATIQKAIDRGGTYDAEYMVVDADGEEKVLHAKGKIFLDENGEARYLTGTNKDVTMQHITELRLADLVETRTAELRRANLELRSVNDNLQQFVYIASHDLQEPLRKINIFSDIMLQQHQGGLDANGKVQLGKIADAAKRMASLIKDLLEFSRITSVEGEFVPTDLNEVLGNLKVDYELLIQQTGAVLKIDKLCVIEAIPLQMNQLFYNLIGNALKFSKPGVPPTITITSRFLLKDEVRIYETLDLKMLHCEIVVKDEGIGFDQQLAEQIFVIFKRLHGRDQYEGTGIGLALCKRIVDNHQGVIFAKSTPGEGTEFHVILPVGRGQ